MRQRRLPLAGPAQHNARPARSAGGGFARLALLAAVLVLAAAAVSPLAGGLAARAAGPSVAAARGVDATVASVQWTRYSGGDFDYYRFTVCPQASLTAGACQSGVFTSPAYFDADSTGPVSVTGLDPDTAYGVVLEVWIKGRDSAIRSTATIPAQPAISFGGSTVADQSYAEGAAIAALTLPQASGGAGTLTYSVSPALPEGLSFDASARTITGTPAAAQDASAYTYSATDGTDTAALSFSIRVAAQGAAESANAGQGATPDSKPPDRPKSVVVTRTDGALHAIWLAVRGATSYHVTYSSDGGASWSLAALNHPGSSITIGGVDNARTYIVGVRARGDGGDSGWLNSPPAGPFTPTKTPSPDRSLTFGSHTVPDQSWTKDTALDTLRLPLATVSCNGAVCTTVVPEITYTLSPGLPAGASFDAAARTITGTPTAEAASATYTYTAAADGYDSVSLTFTIAVSGPTSPQPALSFGDATVDDQAYLQGTAIDTLTLPAATGGGSPTYSLSPTLPAGLSFDATARTITGTPTEAAPSASYSYSATDGTDTATLTFKIEVLSAEEGASAQAGLSWVTTPTDQKWQQGTAANVTMPAATGANTIVYSLTNSGDSKNLNLPGGLSWNGSTRTISGTPTKWFPARVFVYNAAATNKGTHANLIFQVADTNGNYPPHRNIKSNKAQLLAQLWSHYDTNPGMSCYSGSITFAPSSGHSVHFVDPDGDTMTFTAGSSDMVSTTINSSGYAVMTLKHPPIDWYYVEYRATDPSGLYDTIQLGVKSFKCTHWLSVQENKPKDTVVGSVGGSNPGGSSFSLSGTDADKFDIDSTNGQITVKDGTTLDYETKTHYTGQFRYTVSGKTAGGDFRIDVGDVRAPNVDRPTLAQNTTSPTTAIDVTWTAPTPMTGTTINDYDVRYREWTTSTWTELPDTTNSTATSATITGLTAGKEYEVQVRSQIADEGPGHWSGSSIILYVAENTAADGNVGGKFNVNATDYYPLQFTLGGTDGSKFKLSTDTGYKTAQSAQIQVKTGNVPDYENKATYNFTLRAVENNLQRNILDVTFGILLHVTDVNEPPPKLSAPTVAANSTTPTTKIDVSWTAPTMTGKPAVSDYDVQYRLSGDSSWTDASFTGTGTSTTLTGLTSGKTYEVQVRAVNDEGNGGWSDSGTAITTAGGVTRSIAENSAAGTNVGTAVAAKANASYTYTYSLDGTDKDKFEIGSTTGQITVKTGNVPDYEAKTSYSVTVKVAVVAAGGGGSAQSLDPNAPGDYEIPVSISVTDVNEPPPKLSAPTVTANSTTPTTKIDVSWTAPTTTQMSGKPAVTDYDVQYRLSGASTWTDASFTGTGTSTTLTGLTAGKTYEVQVRAVNAEGNGAWSDSGTAITTAGGVTRSIAENSAAGTNVGAAVTAKANTSYTYTHALSGTDAGKFEIGSTTGQITVKTGTSLDYETKTSYSVTVTITVAAKSQVNANAQSLDPNAPGNYTIPVTINVTNVNEGPEFADDTATRSIAENSASETNIGAAVTAGADPEGDTLTYSLTGTDAAKFDIGSSTGQISVKEGNVPDYEAKTSYSVTVNVTDEKAANGTADTAIDDTIAVTINVNDVSEPPAKPAAPTVTANSATPTTKLDVSWTAPDMTGKPAISDYDVQYRKAGDSSWTDASFTGTTTSTTLTGLTAGKTYEVQVRATNDEGDSDWSNSGTAITLAGGVTRSVKENSDAGTNVGAPVTATSNPNSYTLTHSLGGTHASKFDISSSTGQITVKEGTSLDHETTPSYSVIVTVNAASAGAQSSSLDPNAPGDYEIPVTITVTDVNDRPTFDDGATTTRSVAENSAVGTNVGDAIAATDEDGDTLTYSLTGTDASKFDISSSTGQISVKTGNVPDYEAKTSYSVTVKVTDGKDDDGDTETTPTTDDTIAVTINVTDVAEPPAAPAAPTVAVNSTTPTTKLDVSWTAPDMTGKPAISDYDVQYRLSGDSSWTSHSFTGTGTSTTISGLTAGKSYEVQVRAVNDEGDGAWSSSGTAITEAGGVTRSIAENSAAGTAVGSAVTATSNPNGYELTHSLGGTDAASFTIESSTGQIKVKAALDYETKSSYSVIVTMRAAVAQSNSESREPNAPGDYTVPVTITVTDVNEPPQFPSATATRAVEENSVAGTNIGAVITATDQDGDTLTYSLTGTDAASFNIGEGTGQITVKSGNVPDHESKASYSVTVNVTDKKKADGTADTAIDDTIAVTVNITDADEPPAKPAAPTVAANSATPTSKVDVNWTAPDMTGKPAITDYDVRYRLSGGSAWTSHSFSGTGTSTSIAGLDSGKSYEVQVRAANDEGTGGWSDSGTAITTAGGVSRKVDENSAAGTAVGAPVTATSNPNGYALTHTLSGTDAASFSIDGSSGQIKVKAALDYETKKTYSVVVTVKAASAGGVQAASLEPNAPGSYTVPVSIKVTDVNETARFSDPDPSSHSVPENSPAGIKIGAPVTAVDPEGDALTYSLSGTDAAKFDIGSATGQITLGRGTNLDYESGTISFDVTVNATDGKDENDDPDTAIDHTIDVSIGVTDVLEPPEAPSAPGASPSATAPSTALDVTWTAPRMTGKPPITGYDVHYRRVGDSNWISHSFTGTGTSTTIKGLTSGTTYEVRVNATNDEGTSPWSDSATAAPSAAGASRSVAENSPAGTAVGAPVSAGSGSGLTHTLSGTDASMFAIDAGTGQISVGSGTALDHESRASYSVSVSVSPGSHTVPVTITVTDADEPPDAPAAPSVSAGASAPTTELDVTWTAPDTTGKPGIASYGVRYRKAGAVVWTSHPVTGAGTSATIAGLTPGTSYEVQIQAGNEEGLSAWSATGTGSTNLARRSVDVATPPTKSAGPPGKPDAPTVTQDSAAPTSALVVDWSAPSSNGSAITGYRLRYRAEGDSAWTTQTLGAATTARLSGLASATVYEAQVRAVNTLGAGPWSDTGTGATATPNGAPVFPLPGSPLSRSVAENSPAGTAVGGPVEATDPEGDALTYAISGAAEFTIDSATGQIRVAQGADIDYESVSSYTVTVTVTDGLDALGNADSSADDSKQVNISVIDVDETEPVTPDVSEPEVEQQAEPEQQAESAVELEEPRPNAAPSLSAPAGLEVAENSPAGTAVGDPVPATDPEGDTLTFALSGAAEFSIDPATGQITVAEGAALDHESASSYTVTVTVSDGLDAAGNADPSADDSAQIAIAVTDVDEPPARPGAPSLTRDRNSPTSKLIVAWDAPANAGGPAITGYDLRYRAKGAADWTDQPVSGTATTAAIGGLEPGTAYEAQVRAINDEGAGPWSEPGSGSTARPFGKTVYPFHEGGIARVTATTPAPQPAEEKAPAVEPTPTPAPTPTASPVQSGLRVINPSDKNYRQGETIRSFNVIVFGGPTTVTLSGLPDGLSYASGAVSGTVASDAKAGDYSVTITASDAIGVGATGEFTITVTEPGAGILQLRLFTVPVWQLSFVPASLLLLLLAYRRWRSRRAEATLG